MSSNLKNTIKAETTVENRKVQEAITKVEKHLERLAQQEQVLSSYTIYQQAKKTLQKFPSDQGMKMAVKLSKEIWKSHEGTQVTRKDYDPIKETANAIYKNSYVHTFLDRDIYVTKLDLNEEYLDKLATTISNQEYYNDLIVFNGFDIDTVECGEARKYLVSQVNLNRDFRMNDNRFSNMLDRKESRKPTLSERVSYTQNYKKHSPVHKRAMDLFDMIAEDDKIKREVSEYELKEQKIAPKGLEKQQTIQQATGQAKEFLNKIYNTTEDLRGLKEEQLAAQELLKDAKKALKGEEAAKATELKGYLKATEKAFNEMDLAINTAHALETKEGMIMVALKEQISEVPEGGDPMPQTAENILAILQDLGQVTEGMVEDAEKHIEKLNESVKYVKKVKKTLHTWKPSEVDAPKIERGSNKKNAIDIMETLKSWIKSLYTSGTNLVRRFTDGADAMESGYTDLMTLIGEPISVEGSVDKKGMEDMVDWFQVGTIEGAKIKLKELGITYVDYGSSEGSDIDMAFWDKNDDVVAVYLGESGDLTIYEPFSSRSNKQVKDGTSDLTLGHLHTIMKALPEERKRLASKKKQAGVSVDMAALQDENGGYDLFGEHEVATIEDIDKEGMEDVVLEGMGEEVWEVSPDHVRGLWDDIAESITDMEFFQDYNEGELRMSPHETIIWRLTTQKTDRSEVSVDNISDIADAVERGETSSDEAVFIFDENLVWDITYHSNVLGGLNLESSLEKEAEDIDQSEEEFYGISGLDEADAMLEELHINWDEVDEDTEGNFAFWDHTNEGEIVAVLWTGAEELHIYTADYYIDDEPEIEDVSVTVEDFDYYEEASLVSIKKDSAGIFVPGDKVTCWGVAEKGTVINQYDKGRVTVAFSSRTLIMDESDLQLAPVGSFPDGFNDELDGDFHTMASTYKIATIDEAIEEMKTLSEGWKEIEKNSNNDYFFVDANDEIVAEYYVNEEELHLWDKGEYKESRFFTKEELLGDSDDIGKEAAELRKNQKALQVLINGNWEYVFSKTEGKADPVTTPNRRKAIHGDKYSLAYFERYFGNHEFRIEDPSQPTPEDKEAESSMGAYDFGMLDSDDPNVPDAHSTIIEPTQADIREMDPVIEELKEIDKDWDLSSMDEAWREPLMSGGLSNHQIDYYLYNTRGSVAHLFELQSEYMTDKQLKYALYIWIEEEGEDDIDYLDLVVHSDVSPKMKEYWENYEEVKREIVEGEKDATFDMSLTDESDSHDVRQLETGQPNSYGEEQYRTEGMPGAEASSRSGGTITIKQIQDRYDKEYPGEREALTEEEFKAKAREHLDEVYEKQSAEDIKVGDKVKVDIAKVKAYDSTPQYVRMVSKELREGEPEGTAEVVEVSSAGIGISNTHWHLVSSPPYVPVEAVTKVGSRVSSMEDLI